MRVSNLIKINLPETVLKNPGNEVQQKIYNITLKNKKEAYLSQDIFIPNADQKLKDELTSNGIYFEMIKPVNKPGVISFKGE